MMRCSEREQALSHQLEASEEALSALTVSNITTTREVARRRYLSSLSEGTRRRITITHKALLSEHMSDSANREEALRQQQAASEKALIQQLERAVAQSSVQPPHEVEDRLRISQLVAKLTAEAAEVSARIQLKVLIGAVVGPGTN